MEMELNKRKIEFYDCDYHSSVLHEESGELIIPDTSPDMIRIVSARGRAYAKEKSQIEGTLSVKGVISGCVLYVADGEESVRKLELNMPFNHSFESKEICNDAKCTVVVKLISLEGREINSRKIVLRAHVFIEIKCHNHKTMDLTEAVSENDTISVEIKNSNIDFCLPVCIKERSFTIIDDIEIPESQPQLDQLLNDDVELKCTDKKIIGNKAILKGIANIKYTYLSKDGGMYCCEHNLPYSQIIDIDDVAEGCDLATKINVRMCDIDPVHDMNGDMKYLSVNIVADTVLTISLKYENETIEDLYSTTHDINALFEEMTVKNAPININRRVSLNENIETENTVKNIIDTRITIDPAHFNNGALKNNALIQLIYLSEDNCIYGVERKCVVECDLSVPRDAEIECETEIAGVTASGIGNKISVYFSVDYDVKILGENKIRNLKNLNVGIEKDRSAEEACVIVKHVYREEPIWNLAKKYNTTVDEIAAANCLDFSETVEPGSMILIPCGK